MKHFMNTITSQLHRNNKQVESAQEPISKCVNEPTHIFRLSYVVELHVCSSLNAIRYAFQRASPLVRASFMERISMFGSKKPSRFHQRLIFCILYNEAS
jgi:hypothetical protein